MTLKREEYRAKRDEIDYYLNTIQESDYSILYKLLGNMEVACSTLESEDAKNILKLIRKYYQDQMDLLK